MTQPTQEYRITRSWSADDTTANWDELVSWCIEHFGLPGARWLSSTTMHHTVFIFYDIKDASLFTLRWMK